MAQKPGPQVATDSATWCTQHVAILAVGSLLVGLLAGYLLPASSGTYGAKTPFTAKTPGGHPPMTMEQMKIMADRNAAPLLEKLKSHPGDAELLGQLGALYSYAHQFQESAEYFSKSLQADPRSLIVRTQLASSLYYKGDVDDAVKELQIVLKSDPKNVDALFNLGMMKWKGKGDPAAAIKEVASEDQEQSLGTG
jgi:cytochrome c-type biogenesis protein CcmH/NrfG